MKLEPVNIVCPACGNANYMRHLIGKNVGHFDLKCINCNSYFNFDELYNRRIGEVLKRKPSNADHIRAMTDEELAEFINKINCHTNLYGYDPKEAILGWLKQGGGRMNNLICTQEAIDAIKCIAYEVISETIGSPYDYIDTSRDDLLTLGEIYGIVKVTNTICEKAEENRKREVSDDKQTSD